MIAGEEAEVVGLVLHVFSTCVAPLFSCEGVEEFKKYVNEASLSERFQSGNPVILARCDDKTIGVIEIRDNSHIALLFVKQAFHNKGVARQLLHQAIDVCSKRNPDLQKITVNASPNACDAYRSLGFKGENIIQDVNGIRFVPLELALY